MEQRGWLTRADDPLDARKHLVYITPEGRRIHDIFDASVPQARAAVLAGISAEEAATVARVLSRIEFNLEKG
jgi:DNA-binding MarR family transcriptional regulator